MPDYAFTTVDLTAMQAAQEAHMMDTCTIDVYTDGGADPYGAPSPTWVSGSPMACGFNTTRVEEVLGQTMVEAAEAALRLPIGTAIDPKDRVTITKRHGVAVSAVQYAVVGTPRRGPSGLVVGLVKVND